MEPYLNRCTIHTEDEIRRVSEEMDSRGAHAPIKDEIAMGPTKPDENDLDHDATTDEESELPGTRRPPKGSGWWGRGPPLRPNRKGVPREFVEGGGLCSPGRWPVSQRALPDESVARELRRIIEHGLREALSRIEQVDPQMDDK